MFSLLKTIKLFIYHLGAITAGTATSTMYTMQCVYSQHGLYRLCLQPDGNFVGYDTSIANGPTGGSAFWATMIFNFQGTCVMQTDGNFVCYDTSNTPKVSTGTNGKGVGPSYRLIMQNDRNIVVYDGTNKAIWASNTAR